MEVCSREGHKQEGRREQGVVLALGSKFEHNNRGRVAGSLRESSVYRVRGGQQIIQRQEQYIGRRIAAQARASIWGEQRLRAWRLVSV